ncbi:MAG: hypothetical protein AB7L13_18555 [Acidimicrobiia bacterium]
MHLKSVRTERWASTGLGAGLSIVGYPSSERVALLDAFTALAADLPGGPLLALVEPPGQAGGFVAPVVVHPVGFGAWVARLRAEAAELEDRYSRLNVEIDQAQARLAEIDIEISHATRVESDRQALLAELARSREQLRALSADRQQLAEQLTALGYDETTAERIPVTNDPRRLADGLERELDRLVAAVAQLDPGHPMGPAALAHRHSVALAAELTDQAELDRLRPERRAELDRVYGELQRSKIEAAGARSNLTVKARVFELEARVRDLLQHLDARSYADVQRQAADATNPFLATAVAVESEAIDFWLHELVCIGAEGDDDLAEVAQVAQRYLYAAGDCIGSRFLGPVETVDRLRALPIETGVAPVLDGTQQQVIDLRTRDRELRIATKTLRATVDRLRLHAAGSLGTALRTTSTILDARQAERAGLLDEIDAKVTAADEALEALDECQRELRILDARVLATQQPQWVTILSEPGRAVVASVGAALQATAASAAPVAVFDPTLAVDAAEAALLLDELDRLAVGRQIVVLTDDPLTVQLDRPGMVAEATNGRIESDVS